jgi:hypothetical protein
MRTLAHARTCVADRTDRPDRDDLPVDTEGTDVKGDDARRSGEKTVPASPTVIAAIAPVSMTKQAIQP